MSLYKGSNLISGHQVLYSTTGQNTDGAMTQKATTQAINSVATDLDGKADTDLTNVTDTGYIKMAGAGMPSNTYIDLTLGASGSTYTAPADGYFIIQKRTNANTSQYLSMTNTTSGMSQERNNSTSGNNLSICLPFKKNDVCQINYNAGGNVEKFKFYYAQGSESEV